MKNQKKLAMFEGKKIRRHWDSGEEKWYFSIVDVVSALTDSVDPRNYWKVLKNRLKNEGSEVVTKCNQLKMQAADGKYYLTDAADTEIMFRIIQSIPSPNAEPFKLWLARVGYERVEETHDPELAINRALKNYLRKGYSKDWINQRLKSIEIRKALTDEWENRGVKAGDEFAILTDDITLAWAGIGEAVNPTEFYRPGHIVYFICLLEMRGISEVIKNEEISDFRWARIKEAKNLELASIHRSIIESYEKQE